MAFVDIVGSENRLKRSQDQSSSVWQELGGVTKTANVVAGPDGTISGGKVAFAGATNSALMQAGNGAMVSGKVYTWSLWVKGVVGGETFKLLLSDGISSQISSEYTATTKWKRYSVSKTSAGTNVGSVQIRNATTDTGKEVYIWGGQLEESKTASSYKPTTINVVTPSAGSDGVWEFEDSATVSNTYPDSADGADTTVAGGVRTYNKPGDENGGQELSYLRVRKKGQINLFSYSEDITNNYWSTTGNPGQPTREKDVIVAPDGSNTGNKLTQHSGATNMDTNNLRKLSMTSVSGTSYVISCFAKFSENRNFFALNEHLSSTSFKKTWFNISNGTIGTTHSDHTAKISDEGNGWYRCSIALTSSVNVSDAIVFFTAAETDGSHIITANGGSIFLWGLQWNEGTLLTPYIKTTNAASTTIERGEVSKTYYDNQ